MADNSQPWNREHESSQTAGQSQYVQGSALQRNPAATAARQSGPMAGAQVGHGREIVGIGRILPPANKPRALLWILLAFVVVLVLLVVFLLGRLSAAPRALPGPSAESPGLSASRTPSAPPSPAGGETSPTNPGGRSSTFPAESSGPATGKDIQWQGPVRIGDDVCINFEKPPPHPSDGAFADLCHHADQGVLEVVIWASGSVWTSPDMPSKQQCVESLATQALSRAEQSRVRAQGAALCIGGNMGDNVIFVRVRSVDSSAVVVDAVMWH